MEYATRVMKKKFRCIVRGLFLGVLLQVTACSDGSEDEVIKAEYEVTLRSDLALGSTVAEVITYLDSQEIEHSGFLTEHQHVKAIVRNIGGETFVKTAFQLQFNFEEKNKLTDIEIKKLYTGP